MDKTFTRYEDALAYIFEAIDYEKTAKFKYDAVTFNLDRVRRFMAAVGNPHLGLKMAHVAGTKGKGSTATMLASVLTRHGLRTGLFTSPHLVDLRERFVVDGRLADKQAVVERVNRLVPYLEAERRRDRRDSPTFFEIITALGFSHFQAEAVDAAVIEVGLGGRLDSTNVITPLVSVITTIDFDHTDKLGNTLAAIAGEKAGIIKAGVPVVCSPQHDEALRVVLQKAQEMRSPLTLVGRDASLSGVAGATRSGRRGVRFSLTTGKQRYDDLFVPLLGEHQAVNAAAAVVTAEILQQKGLLQLRDDALRQALETVRVPGRVEVVSETPLIVIDTAHNPVSVRALCRTLASNLRFDRLVLLIAMVKDKDIAGFLREILPRAAAVVATKVDNPRAADAEYLRDEIVKLGFTGPTAALPDPREAFDRALSLTGPRDLLCVTGSFYLAGRVKELLQIP